MSLLAPWYLVAAAGVALGVVALHFFARQRPRVMPLPTARFVPEQEAAAPSRTRRPTDLPLLALRVLLVLLAGAAFARPRVEGARRDVTRVVLLDVSRAVASPREAADSAAGVLRPGDVVIAFDTAARVVRHATADSLRGLGAREEGGARGSLSAALVQAHRSAGELREEADSLELVLVSPFVREQIDSATMPLRALWRGRARLIRVAAAPGATRGAIELRATPDDPLRATIALLGGERRGATARIVRAEPSAEDSAWARAGGGALVHWPAWPAGRGDSAGVSGAVVAGEVTVVAPLTRLRAAPGGRPVAWWSDGEPAAVERALGDGCLREVSIGLPGEGDLVLRESVRRLVLALSEPCGGAPQLERVADSLVTTWRGPPALLAAGEIPGASEAASGRPAVWLLAAALALAAAEPLVRRRRTGAPPPA